MKPVKRSKKPHSDERTYVYIEDGIVTADSRRYVERAVTAGVDAKLDVWAGMPHGFVTNIGGFNAAAQAFKASGGFLTERLGSTSR